MKSKKIILYLIIFLLIIFLVIMYYVVNFFNYNIVESISNQEYNENNNELFTEQENDDEWGDKIEITLEDWSIKKEENTYNYFLSKQCLEKVYSLGKEKYNIIDKEAKEILNITQDNYDDSSNIQFYIDQIFKAEVKGSKDVYLIYYRMQTDRLNCSQSVIAIKVDFKNYTFSVYPYEFLKKRGYLNLKENDKLILNNIEDIEENEYNRFRVDGIKKDEETCMKELFEKYKFDLNFDIDHLYSTLNTEYKQTNFESLENFKNFINKNKQLLIKDEIASFETKSNENAEKFIGYGKNNIQYTFNIRSLLDYDLKLN